MKKLIVFCLVAVFAITAHAQKFALLDMEYVLSNVPAYERANEQLNQVSKKWQAEVEALNTEASTMYKNYQNEVVFLSHEQKQKQQEAIMAKEKQAAELKRKYFGPEGELFKKRTSLIAPIQDEIYNAVKDIADQRAQKQAALADFGKGNDIVHQLIDLALLQNGLLKGAALDAFLKRSVALIK